MDDILLLGAKGIQAIPSIAKKDRPGTLLVIEPGAAEGAIAEYLARELKIGGYQRFETVHVFHETRFAARKVHVQAEGTEETFELKVKIAGPENSPLYISVEAEDAIMISRALAKRGAIRSVHQIKGALEAALAEPGAMTRVKL